MITLPDAVLERLSRPVFVANTPTFLWRKLSERPEVQDLSTRYPARELRRSLRLLLEEPRLEGNDLTLAYCLLVAWLLQGPERDDRELTSLERLPLARGMVASRSRSTTTRSANTRSVPVIASSATTSSTRRLGR